MAQRRHERKTKSADTNVYIWKTLCELCHVPPSFVVSVTEKPQQSFEHLKIIANLSSFSQDFG